jgi:hypothetical protein
VASTRGRDKSRVTLFILALAALLASAPTVVAQVPPDERWKTFDTEHFRVTFPEGLDSLARVAGARAEQAWVAVARAFLPPPGGRTEVLLTDHADFSNGVANVAPYRRITVYARPPVDGGPLSHFDDWVELVVLHELVHIFHLDQGGTLSSVLRRVFGRPSVGWPFFPQHTVPRWVTEGLATWYESALTESGRVRGTMQEMELRAALLEGEFENLGQASGQSPVWPGGNRPYVYGAQFFDYLTRTYGDERLGLFVRAVGGSWIPYRLNAAARSAFGVSFSQAWSDWEQAFASEVAALQASLAQRAPITVPELITQSARQALYPQVAPDGASLAFAQGDGRSDTQLRRTAPDGSDADQLARTNGLAAFSWLPDGGIVFTQFRLDGPYRIVSDLHVRAPDGGVRRVTENARLDQPTATPDGRAAVAVRTGPGTTSLVEVDLTSGAIRQVTPVDPNVNWAFPRVSPDGRWIAVSRWRPGAFFDVVILGRTGGVVAEVTRDRALDMSPAWSADGRWLVWTSDRSGIPNVMGVSVDPPTGRAGPVRQVTNLVTGAAFPSVDPSGRWLYFSVANADGLDVARVAFDPARWIDPFPEDPRFRAAEPLRPVAVVGTDPVRDYSPFPTLRPYYWEPVAEEPIEAAGRTLIGTKIGARTHGEDLVGRHRVDVSATVATSGGELDASLDYRYEGLGNPTFALGLAQIWDADGPLLGERTQGVIDTLFIKQREREASASVTLRAPGFRTAAALTLGAAVIAEQRTLLDQRLEPDTRYQLQAPTSDLTDLRASLSLSTARSYAFTNGGARGVSLQAQARRRLHLGLVDSLAGNPARDRSFDEATGRVHAYLAIPAFGYAPHVLALRGAGGASRGPAAGTSHFRIGGASGGRDPVTGYALLGESFQFPVRGYASGVRRGRYAAIASAEYRLPLFIVNRGLGALPLHFDRTSASLFADAGNAWDGAGGEAAQSALISAGAEVLAELLLFYNDAVTLRAGFGVPLVDAGPGAETPVFYVRFGRSF